MVNGVFAIVIRALTEILGIRLTELSAEPKQLFINVIAVNTVMKFFLDTNIVLIAII